MASRLLTRLDEAIARERRPLEQLLLGAERVGLRARAGRLLDARRAMVPLRARHATHPQPASAAALGMADALIDYHDDLDSQARVKLQSAYASSVEAGRASLQALCAAWLAHLDYVRNDLPGMVDHAALALRLAAPEHHAARSRASLVIANSYHHAGHFDRARPWYERARRHAHAEGDEATLGAVLHNMAALRVYLAREQAVKPAGRSLVDEAAQALAVTESSAHFDAGIGTHVLPVLQPILRAQVLSIQGRHAQAMAHYEVYLRDALAQGLSRIECSLRADMAWCRLKLSQPLLAREQAAAAEAAIEPGCDVDELAFSHGRLAQVWAGLGQDAAAARHAQQAEQHWARHAEDQARIVLLLDAALPPALDR